MGRSAPLLADFELYEELGQGATSVVYRARRRGSRTDVALKVVRVRRDGQDDAHDDEPFVREARTAARLSHRNIIAPLDARTLPDGRVALVMPLVQGGTLRRLLRESGQLPVQQVERVVRDIAGALAHAHARGVAHLDVKPENIFLDARSGRALLADFGIARSLGADHAFDGFAGTPTYAAPEQIDGQALSGATDLYALGLVAWEMLTGERPWLGDDINAILRKQRSDALPPLGALRPDVPERLHFLVERLTQKSPFDRWSDADAFLREWKTAEPREGWRRWRQLEDERARAWRDTHERLMSDVAGFADRVNGRSTEIDLPTLERLDRPPRAKRHWLRSRIAVLAAVLVAATIVAGVLFAVERSWLRGGSSGTIGMSASRD